MNIHVINHVIIWYLIVINTILLAVNYYICLKFLTDRSKNI